MQHMQSAFILLICLSIPSYSFDTNQMDLEKFYTSLEIPQLCLSTFNASEVYPVCLIPKSKTFKEASKFCIENDMTLYEINSDEEMKAIFSNAEHFFSTGGGTVIWINGKWSKRTQAWYAFPQHEPFYLTDVFNDTEKYRGVYGRCLAIESMNRSGYEIKNFSCDVENYFYCKISELDD